MPAANSSILVTFHDATATFGGMSGPLISQGLFLDANPATWEPATVSGVIPVGTRWLVTQVAYNNASLLSNNGALAGGYVDSAFTEIRIVPEPTALSLAGLGVVSLLRSRRR